LNSPSEPYAPTFFFPGFTARIAVFLCVLCLFFFGRDVSHLGQFGLPLTISRLVLVLFYSPLFSPFPLPVFSPPLAPTSWGPAIDCFSPPYRPWTFAFSLPFLSAWFPCRPPFSPPFVGFVALCRSSLLFGPYIYPPLNVSLRFPSPLFVFPCFFPPGSQAFHSYGIVADGSAQITLTSLLLFLWRCFAVFGLTNSRSGFPFFFDGLCFFILYFFFFRIHLLFLLEGFFSFPCPHIT